MKKSGFTLAEILITLGIIGVITMLTMPTLISNYQKKVFSAQIHEAYSILNRATEGYFVGKGTVNIREAGLDSTQGIYDFLTSSFKVTHDCTGKPQNCFADSYKNIQGDAVDPYIDTQTPCAQIASGAVICIQGLPGDNFGGVVVDVNGKKGPNTVGRDVFFLGLNTDGSVGNYVATFTPQAPSGGPGGFSPQPEQPPCQYDDSSECLINFCKSAGGIVSRGATYCFDALQRDNFEMNY